MVTFEIIATSSQNDLFRNARSSSSFGVGLPRTVCAFVSGLSVLDETPKKNEWGIFFIPDQVKLLPCHQWSCHANSKKKERCLPCGPKQVNVFHQNEPNC